MSTTTNIIFEGDRTSFNNWMNATKNLLMKAAVYKYVNPTGLLVLPPTLVLDKTDIEQNALSKDNFTKWFARRSKYEKDLNTYEEQMIEAFGIIRGVLAPTLMTLIDTVAINGNPRLAWNLLVAKYGITATNATDKYTVITKLRMLTMKTDDKADQWSNEFETLRCSIELDVTTACEIIFTANLLPTRFDQCMKDLRMKTPPPSYLETIEAIINDDRDFQSQKANLPSKKTVQAITVPKFVSATQTGKSSASVSDDPEKVPHFSGVCHNCKNIGHYARHCRSPYCTKCHTFNQHVFADCPSGTSQRGVGGRNMASLNRPSVVPAKYAARGERTRGRGVGRGQGSSTSRKIRRIQIENDNDNEDEGEQLYDPSDFNYDDEDEEEGGDELTAEEFEIYNKLNKKVHVNSIKRSNCVIPNNNNNIMREREYV